MSDFCEAKLRQLRKEEFQAMLRAFNEFRKGNVDEALEILRQAFGCRRG